MQAFAEQFTATIGAGRYWLVKMCHPWRSRRSSSAPCWALEPTATQRTAVVQLTEVMDADGGAPTVVRVPFARLRLTTVLPFLDGVRAVQAVR